MRISDWSSDVCSSDLALEDDAEAGEQQHRGQKRGRGRDRAPARDEAVERRHDFCLTLSAIPRRRELMERRLRAAAAASTWKPTRPSARVKWIMPRADPSCASVKTGRSTVRTKDTNAQIVCPLI